MRRYFDFALYFDLCITILLGVALSCTQQYLVNNLSIPPNTSLLNFGISLITVSATLIGFLLTIITVIVTFKKGFEENLNNEIKNENSLQDGTRKTIFEKKTSKEKQFYGTPTHKSVVKVFVNATFEIGLVLFVLLSIQFSIIHLSDFNLALISFCCFFLVVLSVIKSLYIFKLFLNVHLN